MISLPVRKDHGKNIVELLDDSARPPVSFIPEHTLLIQPERMQHACQFCLLVSASLMMCGKCKTAQYCNAECQRADWARHKINDCRVRCPNDGCTVPGIPFDGLELLLARVCGMQQEVTAVNAELSASKKDVKALQEEAAKEVIVLQIKHAELTGADQRTRINSEQRVVDGGTFRVYVETSNPNYYGVYLQLTNGPLPCKVKIAFELVHHDGQAASAKKMSSTSSHTYTEKHGVVGYSQFVPKARLADAATSPYVKDGYVSFKCVFEVVE